MKTDASSQTAAKCHVDRRLEALRVQSDYLHDLALKTTDRDERSAQAEDRRLKTSRR